MKHIGGPTGARVPSSTVNDSPVLTSHPHEEASLAVEYARTILRYRKTILVCALLGLVGGIASTLRVPATYRSRTSLDVQSINEEFLNLKAVDQTERIGGNSVETVLQTEIKLLQSDSLLERVVAKLRSTPAQASGPGAPSPNRLLSLLHLSPPAPGSRESLLKDLAAHVAAKPLGMTRLIEVSCVSVDRALAASFCNTLAEEFLAQDQENRWSAARGTIEFLSRQLTEVRSKLQSSEDKLQDFQLRNRLLFSPDKESVAQGRLRLLQSDATQAEADRAAREAQYRVGTRVDADSLPAVLDDEPSRQYRIKLAELNRRRAELSTTFTPESPQMEQIDAQIAALRASIQEARSHLVERLSNEFAAAEAREKTLTSAYRSQEQLVAGQVAKTAQLNMLQREAESGRQIYLVLLQKVKEAGFASAMKAEPIRVVDRAEPAVTPFGPRRKVQAAIGLALGFFGGVVIALFRMRSDTSLRLPGDAARHLSIREFGVIPRGTAATLSNEDRSGWRGLRPSLELVTWSRKRSLMAEAYRSAMSSILYSGHLSPLRSIVVSSPRMGEGKTTLVSNLAIAFAEAGHRVIVVDADLRMPRLHKIFDIGNNSGLQQALRGENDPATCPIGLLAHETLVPNLNLLPSGSGSEDPGLLLHSANLAVLLRRLESEFDLVLIDSPPLLHLPDARTIAQLANGMILVLRAGVATRESAAAAAQILAGDQTTVLGIVLNDFDPRKEAVSGYYRDYYRYRGQVSVS